MLKCYLLCFDVSQLSNKNRLIYAPDKITNSFSFRKRISPEKSLESGDSGNISLKIIFSREPGHFHGETKNVLHNYFVENHFWFIDVSFILKIEMWSLHPGNVVIFSTSVRNFYCIIKATICTIILANFYNEILFLKKVLMILPHHVKLTFWRQIIDLRKFRRIHTAVTFEWSCFKR